MNEYLNKIKSEHYNELINYYYELSGDIFDSIKAGSSFGRDNKREN